MRQVSGYVAHWKRSGITCLCVGTTNKGTSILGVTHVFLKDSAGGLDGTDDGGMRPGLGQRGYDFGIYNAV